MASAGDFVAAVEWNAARVREYVLGKSGDNGECDCVGLPIGAVQHMGLKWKGLHGSNFAARNRTDHFRRIQGEGSLKYGDLVYKAIAPGDSGYALPDRYKAGGAYYNGDLNDYCHVGVVTGLNPLEITHCTGVPGGIKRDTKIGKWKYCGSCSLIDEETEVVIPVTELYTAVVYAPSGNTVNMRKSTSTKSDVLVKVPIGAEVSVLEELGEWCRISYEGTDGYMMATFLKKVESGDEYPSGETVTITMPRSIAVKVYDAFGSALGFGVG